MLLLITRYLLKEIVDTEIEYIREMKIIKDKFMDYVDKDGEFVDQPVKDNLKSLITKIKFKKIFNFHDRWRI